MEDTLLVQLPEGRRLAVCRLVVPGGHLRPWEDEQKALLGRLAGHDQPGFDQLGLGQRGSDQLGDDRLRS